MIRDLCRAVPALLLLALISGSVATDTACAQQPWANPQWSSPYVRRLPDANELLDLATSSPESPEEVPVPESFGNVPPPSPDTFLSDAPPAEPPPKVWEGSIEMGLNGSDGNSDVFNISIGAHLEGEFPRSVIKIDLNYNNDSTNGVTTANRYFLEGRQEWQFGESAWSFFLQGSLELDQFRAFDQRVAGNAGLSYQYFKNDMHSLKQRFGAGVSREIGGPDDSWVPEAVFGMDYSRKISERQKISASADYYPSWEDFQDFRLVARADWEVLLDAATNLSLKLGLVDTYDSTPNGAKANDVDYTAVLLWKF